MRERIGDRTRLCATIKANAYGHGVSQIVPLLQSEHVEWVCVYSLEEAAALADFSGLKVLVLAPVVMNGSGGVPKNLHVGMRLNVTDAGSARQLSAALRDAGVRWPLNVHVQIDTGLTRVGVEPSGVATLVAEIQSLPNLRVEGLFSHLSHGDVGGHATLEQEMRILRSVTDPLKEKQPELLIHLQNSGGCWNVSNISDEPFDMVRVGIALYGLQPSTANRMEGLLPIARVTARILAIHDRPAHTGVGYGHSFVTARDSRLGIVPVGYADGYPRGLSNRGVGQLGNVDVPLVGRVSMDQIIVDVTEVPSARVGDEVTLISEDPAKSNSLDRMADAMGTIGYELATHFGGRLDRVVTV